MRKAALVGLVIAMAAWGTGAAFGEIPVGCGTLFIEYAEDVGFASPEAAVADAVADFESDVDVPEDVEEGENSEGVDTVVVDQNEAGFITTLMQDCDSTTTLTFGGVAEAHPGGDYVNPIAGGGADVWAGAHPSITYKFTAEVGSAKQSAIKRGIETWDAVNMDLNLAQGAQQSNSPVGFACNATNNNEIHYEDIGDASGAVLVCPAGQTTNIGSFEMAFDVQSYWYSGADPAGIGGGQLDLESVSAHESGHILGIRHLDDPPPGTPEIDAGCVPGGGASTMCLGGGVGFGETFTRSLEFHDKHTITPLYP